MKNINYVANVKFLVAKVVYMLDIIIGQTVSVKINNFQNFISQSLKMNNVKFESCLKYNYLITSVKFLLKIKIIY